jgi:hypothetical protein
MYMRQNQLIVTLQNQLAGLLAFLLLNITKIPLDSIDEKTVSTIYIYIYY